MRLQDAQHTTEATVIALTNKATGAGSLTAFVAWLAQNGYVALFGLALALLGFLTNLYFQWRRDQREEREYQRRMSQKPGEL